ncbi:MAG: DUF2333 family protein [Desulfobacterales bacterium]|jgi:hypothetical protein
MTENESPHSAPQIESTTEIKKDPEFKKFATKRIIVGLLVAVALIWGAAMVIDYLDKPSGQPMVVATHTEAEAPREAAPAAHGAPAVEEGGHETAEAPAAAKTEAGRAAVEGSQQEKAAGHTAAPQPSGHAETQAASATAAGEAPSHVAPSAPPARPGVAFTEALIGPLRHEVKERFWGWRPNDLIDVTDNVNNIQLGVLEVTRRATVELAERISRTGSTASFDPHLERAMNWLMVKATEYWFPSAESKYSDAIAELTLYRDRLQRGEANFFTRADNLIPLLSAFEDLLGSCDENLVKQFEDDGEPVSHFMADDYFYYARGVARAMLPILEAVAVDFHTTLQNRNGLDVIHHAIHSLTIADNIDPWYVTEADLDGILANHRANIAAPISHARFYISVLINALST